MKTIPRSLLAGLLLAALPMLEALGLVHPTASAVLEATGATRTTAYKFKARLEALLPGLVRGAGRPAAPPPARPAELTALAYAVRDFLFEHPGAVGGTAVQRRYSDGFRRFVLGLREEHRDIDTARFAEATGVAVTTLNQWLRAGTEPEREARGAESGSAHDAASAQLQSVLDAWERWDDKKRGFRAFCKHVQSHLAISIGKQLIQDLLHAHRVRRVHKRGRPADASAHRKGFETFFPGAQWVGDGTELVVTLNGERHTVNLELLVDPHSGALIGADVRRSEDATAVCEAFRDGVETTGKPPIALLLDNKPSNHTQQVDDALGDTLRLRSRPFVPTDKPHVEGAFGLLSQQAPPLDLSASTAPELAGELARLAVTIWARTLNHRPRSDRNDKSRAQLYQETEPSPEQIARARAALRQRLRTERKARETRRRRTDPLVRAVLDAAFERLGLDDPEGHLRSMIATWPFDAIVEGIAIFQGRKNAGTLPQGVDARYLRGIIRNLAEKQEGLCIAEALLRERLAARDLALAHLRQQRDALVIPSPNKLTDLLETLLTKALDAPSGVQRTFWLLEAAEAICNADPQRRSSLLKQAANCIHATFAVPHDERLEATRFLYRKVIPVT